MLTINGNDITITRGDSTPAPGLIVPILNADGTPYALQENESVAIQVRKHHVTGNGTEPAVIFDGTVTVNSDSQPVWYISATDTNILAGDYCWDAQISFANGDICTYAGGRLTILPEVTIEE